MNQSPPGQFQAILDHWIQEGRITPLDAHFARYIGTQADYFDRAGAWAALRVSQIAGQGGVCLDLEHIADGEWTESDLAAWESLPADPVQFRQALARNRGIGAPGSATPLILEGGRLYLARFWHCERQVVEAIRTRLCMAPTDLDIPRIRDGLGKIFGLPDRKLLAEDQLLAVLSALFHRFCVITGGPGTGKTHTILHLLALLRWVLDTGLSDIWMCAPTGKAVARMQQAVREGLSSLPGAEDLQALLERKSVTLHRLLQGTTDLQADVVVVDEASMVDLTLMAQLMTRAAAHTRIILMGDRDQLASVQPGSVFGDICRTPYVGQFNGTFLKTALVLMGPVSDASRWKTKPGPDLQDAIVSLRHSFRFDSQSGIGALARAIRSGCAADALAVLQNPPDDSLGWNRMASEGLLHELIAQKALDYFGRIWQADSPQEALALLARFRFLCVLRQGPYGAEAVNLRIMQSLIKAGCIDGAKFGPGGAWYHGQPLMVTRNDYQLGLYNGDSGIVWRDSHSTRGDGLSVFFEDGSGLRRVDPDQMPSHETVFALTVHKSQGSEFSEVVLILPDREMPLLTRELVYTAVTRARDAVRIWGKDPKLFAAAVKARQQRAGGLGDALWAPDSGYL